MDGSLRALARSIACVSFVACAHTQAPPPQQAPAPPSVANAEPTPPESEWYSRSVADASRPEPGEISRTLSAISPSNQRLIWEGTPGASRVRVATWTGWDGYDARVGQVVPLGREAWVTPAPDMRDACRALGLLGDALARRLEQLLGLPANNHKTRVVELWVQPSDMFRACIDAEVTDTACQIDAPTDLTDAHRAWFDALRASSYPQDGAGGYPWTQLGYTYDWGRWGSVSSHFGLSEYVVRAGASAFVVSVATTDAYCALDAD